MQSPLVMRSGTVDLSLPQFSLTNILPVMATPDNISLIVSVKVFGFGTSITVLCRTYSLNLCSCSSLLWPSYVVNSPTLSLTLFLSFLSVFSLLAAAVQVLAGMNERLLSSLREVLVDRGSLTLGKELGKGICHTHTHQV